MSKLNRVTMPICDECLGEGSTQCTTPRCINSSDMGAVVVVSRHDPAICDVDGWKMCRRCQVKRAECALKPGTMEELQLCRECDAVCGMAYERLLSGPEVAQA